MHAAQIAAIAVYIYVRPPQNGIAFYAYKVDGLYNPTNQSTVEPL